MTFRVWIVSKLVVYIIHFSSCRRQNMYILEKKKLYLQNDRICLLKISQDLMGLMIAEQCWVNLGFLSYCATASMFLCVKRNIFRKS